MRVRCMLMEEHKCRFCSRAAASVIASPDEAPRKPLSLFLPSLLLRASHNFSFLREKRPLGAV